MLDAILLKKNYRVSVKVTIKTIVSVCLIAISVLLPQLVHVVAGAKGGVTWLPMYLPILIGGCLLGSTWGLGVGVLAPVVSYLITSLTGNAMPALARLPFMVTELAVFALVTGLFSKKIYEKPWLAFPAVISAQLAGRGMFVLSVAIFDSLTSLNVSMIWQQILNGWMGLFVQALIVPVIIIVLAKILKKNE